MTVQPERPAEVIEHILRPMPPWRRDDVITECGRAASEFASVLTRDQAIAKIKAQGRRRAAMSTCMTCWETASRHAAWDQNPVEVISRECSRANWWHRQLNAPPKAVQFRDELRAIAALIEAHRPEFDELLAGLKDTSDLGAARAKRARAEWEKGTSR